MDVYEIMEAIVGKDECVIEDFVRSTVDPYLIATQLMELLIMEEVLEDAEMVSAITMALRYLGYIVELHRPRGVFAMLSVQISSEWEAIWNSIADLYKELNWEVPAMPLQVMA